MKSLRLYLLTMIVLLASCLSYAQTSNTPELNITLSEQRVQFAPTRSFQEMRLEVVNREGEVVFVNATSEAGFAWNLKNNSDVPLAAGLYRYTLTLKFSEELTRQHTGHFIVEKGQDQIWLTANEGATLSGAELNAARSGGRSIAGVESKDNQSAKRAVEGREVVDEKGGKLTDEKKAVKAEKAALLGTLNKVAKFGASGAADTDSTITEDATGKMGFGVTPSATTPLLFNGDINPALGAGLPAFTLQSNLDHARLEMRSASNGGHAPIVQGRASGGTLAAPTASALNQILGGFGGSGYDATNGFAVISHGFIGIRAGELWTPTAHGTYMGFETTANGSLTRTEKMRITGDGNVGIGTTAPTYKLHVEHSGSTGILSKSTSSFSVIDIDAASGDAALRLAKAGVNQWNIRNNPGNDDFQIFELDGGGERMRIENNTGNVVIAQALSSSALRQELNVNAPPNIINGFMGTGSGGVTPGNRVTAGVVGASIGGGGFNGTLGSFTGDNSNRVTDNFATVGGGFKNRAGDDDVTLDDARFATVSGGFNNIATNRNATVGGGEQNIASGLTATVGGGFNNAASGLDSTIAGGAGNLTQGSGATVGGGSGNNAFGQRATASGGLNNVANAPFSVSPGGRDAVASHYGEMAFSSGSFSLNGDAQTSTYVLRNISSNAGVTELFLDGSAATQRLTIAQKRLVAFDIQVVAVTEGGGFFTANYRIRGAIARNVGNAYLTASPVAETLSEDDPIWDVVITADATNQALKITVNGGPTSGTIRWVATVRTTEVSIP